MKTELDQLLQTIVGKSMWTCRRAADMATFQFGRRVPVTTFYGDLSEIGEYALHIQCAWRVVAGDAVIVGSRDLFYPAGFRPDDSIPDDFDWSSARSQRDELLESMFRYRSFTVRDIQLGPAGACRIEFHDSALEIFPDDSLPGEHWRLFGTQDSDMRVVVVTGRRRG